MPQNCVVLAQDRRGLERHAVKTWAGPIIRRKLLPRSGMPHPAVTGRWHSNHTKWQPGQLSGLWQLTLKCVADACQSFSSSHTNASLLPVSNSAAHTQMRRCCLSAIQQIHYYRLSAIQNLTHKCVTTACQQFRSSHTNAFTATACQQFSSSHTDAYCCLSVIQHLTHK
jgi:hypothetical protein